MTTPTNHTSSSIFYFGDMLEPEPSQSSLEQNSSIEESNIFVSLGGEVSSHSRHSSSALSGNESSKAIKSHSIDKTKVMTLAALQERPEEEPGTAPVAVTAVALGKKTFVNGILKPPSYSEPRQNRGLEQPRLTINTEPKTIMDGNSIAGGSTFSETHPPQPLSPTVHTNNQTSGFSESNPRQAFSPTVHRSNQTNVLGVQNQRDKLSSIDEFSMDNIQQVESDDENAERFTAWAIYIALFFLIVLIIACTLLVFSVIRNYGFVTLVLLTIVMVFFAFLACFVDSTLLSQNPNLRPVHQKIVTVMRTTRKILEDEYHLFIRDWKESLLLTQVPENCSHNDKEKIMSDDSTNNNGLLQMPTSTQVRRKKSKVFKWIRPVLGLKKNLFRGKKRQHESQSSPIASYEAPAI